jgi:hypothetical protein
MKKLILFSAIALIFAACSGKKDEEKSGEVKTDTVTQDSSADKKYVDPTTPPSTEYTGDFVVKYETGITRFRGFFRFGKKHGLWTAFFPTGEVQSETEYDNGIKNGRITVYYQNGKIMYEGRFKNDQRDGVWKTYDESGKVMEEKKY